MQEQLYRLEALELTEAEEKVNKFNLFKEIKEDVGGMMEQDTMKMDKAVFKGSLTEFFRWKNINNVNYKFKGLVRQAVDYTQLKRELVNRKIKLKKFLRM